MRAVDPYPVGAATRPGPENGPERPAGPIDVGSPTAPPAAATGLDRTDAVRLAAEHGWPIYVADVGRLRSNIVRMYREFSRTLRDVEISYSFKTNYLARFIQVARELGLTAEVVSELEFDFARDLGFSGTQILVNGPVKSGIFMQRALEQGARVNIDSFEELITLDDLGRAGRSPVDVGLRVSYGFHGRSRFGIDLEDPDICRAIRQVLDAGHVRVAGAHVHTPGRRSPASFQLRLRCVAAAMERVGIARPDYLDVGGGFMGTVPPDLAQQLAEPQASYQEYAEALGETMSGLFGEDQPRLIVEPGTGLLADTMTLYAPVTSVKRSAAGSTVAIVDASLHDIKPLRGTIDPSVRVLGRDATRGGTDLRTESVQLAGNTCMEIDVLHTGLETAGERIAAGDVLEFRNVGAYTVSLRPSFIAPTPAVLESPRRDEPARVLRPRGTSADLGRAYGLRP